ncbi:MAG: hypothetical protein JXQ73_12710, partial [Phycisphaerae bacterium]|nr:hypothetical protein [Phycisphaerae bacterium]
MGYARRWITVAATLGFVFAWMPKLTAAEAAKATKPAAEKATAASAPAGPKDFLDAVPAEAW